jgi:hypothetical protein
VDPRYRGASVSSVVEAVSPLNDPSRSRRLLKIAGWIAFFIALLVVLHLLGVDVWGCLENLWDSLTEISIGYIILGCLFQGIQTALTALGWYGILHYAYPGGATYMAVLTSYATGVALNNFVPANLGTLVTLLIYVAIVRRATFPGVLAGYIAQKIFYLAQIGGYAAKVGVIIVFLAAYGIPVTFGSVMSVLGSNQLPNILSFTPGGVVVNRAFNTFALDSYTDSTTATAYSVSQQLITTAFNVGLAVIRAAR